MKAGMFCATILTGLLGLFLFWNYSKAAVTIAEHRGPVVLVAMIGFGLLATWFSLALILGHSFEKIAQLVTKPHAHDVRNERLEQETLRKRSDN